jgi:hypothetical protein
MGQNQTFQLAVDIKKQSLDDIQQMMRRIAVEETEKQDRQGNKFTRVLSDARDNKTIDQAQRSIEVFFGVKVPREAMAAVEKFLLEGIRQSTGIKTGALRDLDFWQWKYVKQSGGERALGGPQDLNDFAYGDSLILRPKLAYATLVNNIVASRGSTTIKGKGGRVSMGFLGYAAQRAKRSRQFRTLTIYAARSDYKTAMTNYPGRSAEEQSNQGTGFIVIKAKRAKCYRKL